MTYGRFFHTIDAKNRFFVPAQMRSELGSQIILFPSPDDTPCIFVYSTERWEEVCAEIYNLPPTPESRRFQRLFLSQAVAVEPDKSGRVTLNQELKEKSGIKKDIAIIGAAGRVEIWAAEEWAKETEKLDTCDNVQVDVRF